jgi:nitrite reductase/ring-hydroxylating ferredoxin subunit/uncharacterized membrane protein
MGKGIVTRIGEQEWLETPADVLQDAWAGVITRAGRQTANALHGTWLGHPLHPVLTDIPIGAWTAAAVLDAAEALTGDKRCGDGADAAVGIGLIGAVAAAVTGLTEWHKTGGPARRLGLVHGMLNVAASALYASSYVARKAGERERGRSLGWLGFGVAMASGYLGGALVFSHRVGIDHSPHHLPEEWTRILPETDLLEGQLVGAKAANVPVVLLRRGPAIYAIAARCGHLGGPLAEGNLEPGNCVRCPWHGSVFSLEDGHVVEGPSTHPERVFEVRVVDGFVEVRALRSA